MAGSVMIPVAAAGAGGLKLAADAERKQMHKKSTQLYELQKNELARQQAAEVGKHNQELKRTTAAHRARLASQGISSTQGSAEAILKGLQKQSEQNVSDTKARYRAATYQNEIKNGAHHHSDGVDAALSPVLKPSNNFLLGSNSSLNNLKDWD